MSSATIRRAAALALAALGLASCSRAPIPIGISVQFSGRMAEIGLAIRNGASLAAEDVNAAGGVRGRRIALMARDDRGDPSLAPKVDAELVRDGAVAIVGHLTSTLTLASRPVAEAANVVVVSPWSSSSVLLKPGASFFMVFSPSDEEAVAAAGHAFVRSGSRSAYLVWDAGNAAYTERWTGRFGTSFEELGGRIAGRSPYRSADPGTLFAAAAAAVASRADAIVLAADVLDAALLCQRIRMAGGASKIYVSNWAMANDLVANGGAYVEGIITFSNIDTASPDPRSTAFRAAYEKRFGNRPIDAAYLGYECVSVIAEGLRKARSASGLGRAIVEGSPYRGLQGDIAFDETGAPRRELKTFIVRDGAFVREGRLP